MRWIGKQTYHWFAWIILAGFAAIPIVQAEVKEIDGYQGETLQVELVWEDPVDLDLFLTDPTGETIYFANRVSKSGNRMGTESGCKDIEKKKSSYRETAVIQKAKAGRYRVSVDFIKDCGNTSLEAKFGVILKNEEGIVIGKAQSMVQYRLLNPVGWEFKVK